MTQLEIDKKLHPVIIKYLRLHTVNLVTRKLKTLTSKEELDRLFFSLSCVMTERKRQYKLRAILSGDLTNTGPKDKTISRSCHRSAFL
jgi:hypothetical protein